MVLDMILDMTLNISRNIVPNMILDVKEERYSLPELLFRGVVVLLCC